ncbi:MAG: dTDP-4-dehydrorhamnose 3,5-epimerase [Alphaproteobacteria bacterium]
MEVTPTTLPEVLSITPRIHRDARGFFKETWQADRYAAIGVPGGFVQDNLSRSIKGTVRGLHFQEPKGQGKLVSVLSGSVFDVVVDVRFGSPRFGRWAGLVLNAEDHCQLWIPPGFAHGFCVLSETADFFYKCTELYDPACERSVRWDDPAIGIDWPVGTPLLSAADAVAPPLSAVTSLPAYEPAP